jgi:UDP-N-acetylglucosamine--N-acetylmuramyl-(pentapeptide) pyrophosphoryl-undecaprenol N-acetylglucosamine transferase
MNDNAPLILLSAGGSGGHVFPARALAEELLSRGLRVVICTDTRGLKYLDGLNASIPRHIIASGTYTSGLMGKVQGIVELIKGTVQSIRLIRQISPVAAVGFGGYPSAPPLFAAQAMGIPTILHEQNAILGLANKWLAPMAKKIALSYADTVGLTEKMRIKTRFTGNPVRQAIASLSSEPYPSIDNKITIMVVGGSQGAKVFSDIVPMALAALPSDIQKRLTIIQQSRPDAVDMVREIYSKTEMDFEIKSFYDDMPDKIKAAHLLITRSGASTVAELTAAGRPAIYVPFPWNRDNQQVYNAEQVEKAGGGWMILEKNLTVEGLKINLENLLSQPKILQNAAEAAKRAGKINATSLLADLVGEFR